MTGIFICYRRSDSAGHTGRLADDLGEQLPQVALFRDIEAIEAGDDFVHALERAVAASSVMLVVIGPTWATVTTPDGERRLHQEGDFVRMEIEAAVARDMRIIPVLVGEAPMPNAADLPESIHGLLRRHAFPISDRHWSLDLRQLTVLLGKLCGVTPLPSVATQSGAERRWPAVLKYVIGASAIGALLMMILVAVLVLTDGVDPPASEVSTAPALSPIEQRAFLGFWRAENGDEYLIDTAEDNSFYIAAGSRLATDEGFAGAPRPAQSAGEELFGDAKFEGRKLRTTLLDGYNEAMVDLVLEMSADGKTLSGERQDSSGSQPILLTRM